MTDSERYDWYRDEGDYDVELPHGRDPRQFPWGLYTVDSSPLVQVGMFAWFADAEELAAWVREVEPRIYDVDDEEGLQKFRDEVQPALSALSARSDPEAAADQANTAQSVLIVKWWGPFDAMCAGSGELARYYRTEFRERTDGEEDDSSPISPEEIEDFISFISEYGY